jgi:hypothetical protein
LVVMMVLVVVVMMVVVVMEGANVTALLKGYTPLPNGWAELG